MSQHTATLPPLPEGWVWTTLGEVSNINMGQSPPSETYNTEHIGLPFFQGKADFGALYPSIVKWCSEPLKIAERHDILVSVRAPVGPTNLSPTKICIGRGLAAIRMYNSIPYLYGLYFIRANEDFLQSKATGTTFSSISGQVLNTMPFPLAPLAEQTRIVEALETLFTQLDAGVQALKRSQANLQRYRAAVLKAACEGTLVAQDPNDEPASQLLTRILAERYARWEATEHAKGKMPMPSNYKAPQSPDTSNLPDLPEGWVWASLEQISSKVVDGTHHSPINTIEGDYKYITAKNIKEYGIDLSDVTFVTESIHNSIYSRCNPENGDILYIKDGATTGIATINNLDEPFSLLSSVALIKTSKNINNAFIVYILRSPFIYQRIRNDMAGVAITRITLKILNNVIIPLPPLAEQARIVAEVERRLSVVQALEATLEANLARAERLRQSILKQAFSGQLVPQDPRDEPASLLLEQIQAERAPAPKSLKQRNQTRMDLE
ncbi:MAG: restriction endonuclease subunit S [Chloroflexi bacterium]|nr:restriction endonuclease subunit S [Chloroflexota bacterium]